MAAITRRLRAPYVDGVQLRWAKCVLGAHSLALAAQPLTAGLLPAADGTIRLALRVVVPTAAAVGGDLQRLPTRLSYAWALPWDNMWKETWWRLLLQGVPGAGGHDVAVDKACACGWHWQQEGRLPGPAAAAAVRAHVFWLCPVAVAVRGLLQANLPAGSQLQPRHLWLLAPPDRVHPGVWLVAALAALDALAGTRRFMATLQAEAAAQRAVQPAPRGRPARQLTLHAAWRLPPPAAAVAAAPPPPPVVLRGQRDALIRVIAGVQDFAAQGVVPRSWLRGRPVPQDHPFLAVVPGVGGAGTVLRVTLRPVAPP